MQMVFVCTLRMENWNNPATQCSCVYVNELIYNVNRELIQRN